MFGEFLKQFLQCIEPLHIPTIPLIVFRMSREIHISAISSFSGLLLGLLSLFLVR